MARVAAPLPSTVGDVLARGSSTLTVDDIGVYAEVNAEVSASVATGFERFVAGRLTPTEGN